VGGGGEPRRPGVGGGVPHPPLRAALRPQRRRRVGVRGGPRGAAHQRAELLGAAQARREPRGEPLRRAAGDARPPLAPAAGGAALHGERSHPRARRRGRPLPPLHRLARLGRGGRQVRRDQRPHPRRHRQPRLRAGGGRPQPGEPHPVRDLPGREASLLHRGRRHLPLRDRAGRRRQCHRIALLLAPHRPHAALLDGRALRAPAHADHHPGRRQALGPGGRGVVAGGAGGAHRRGERAGDRRRRLPLPPGGGADDRLRRAPRPPRAERGAHAAGLRGHRRAPPAGVDGDHRPALRRLRGRRGLLAPLGRRRLAGERLPAATGWRG
jgi:hypothetical protein